MDRLQTRAAKEMTWREHLARHAGSGKSIAAFCRAEQISQANFYAWRTKLRRGAVGPAVPSAGATFIDLGAVSPRAVDQVATRLSAPATAAAMAATAAPAPQAVVNSSIELRIDLGGGLVLTITRR